MYKKEEEEEKKNTCYMIFEKKTKVKINLDLKINNKEKVKFLGITLDSKLTFSPMVDELKERCNSRLNLIKYLSNKKWVHAIGWRGLARHGRRGMKTLPNWILRMFAILTPSVWKKLWLKLTGPDNRRFELTDGVAHCCLDLFAHRRIE
ncbi:hypothetical protein BpHYR1_014090 [Brachionus plicatilis]|uniref:RNA-directed DNA polymerase from mobile element jockey-like n=1 Tax=Brachionus plicatilis TaxID=10195 RepID=A0A3M7PIH4_BRAPC|nr:hypothetical protein BpHYR1_014090 [Brachionus plicatilis]